MITIVLSSAFSYLSIIDTVARTIGAAGASYCGDLSSIDPAEIEDHRVGGEIRAVVELHALADIADPAQRIAFVDPPRGEQAGRDVGQLVGVGEVPVHDRVVGGVAEEAETLAAIVGNAMRGRQIRRRHADPQNLRRGGSRRTAPEMPRRPPRTQAGHASKLSCRVLVHAETGLLRCKAYATAASGSADASARASISPINASAESMTSQNVWAIADSVALCSSSVNVALPSATKNTL